MVIRAARRFSHLQGKGTHLISQLFQDPDYLAKEDKNCNLHLGQEQKTQSSEKKKGNAQKLL